MVATGGGGHGAMVSDERYLLGHGEGEWARLEAQHAVWREALGADLVALGLGPGARVVDAGCGNGTLLAELAAVVGPEGRVVGIERDPGAAAAARKRVADWPWAQVVTGDLLAVAAPEPADLVVSRWVFSFLPDPAAATRRLAGWLAPGGRLVVQDYDHDGVRVFPDTPEVERVIEALRDSYRRDGGDLWIAGRMPAHFAAAGLELAGLVPHVLAGPPGSAPFEWVGRFLLEHLDTFVTAGALDARDRDAFLLAWPQLLATPGAVLFTPMVVTVAGRR